MSKTTGRGALEEAAVLFGSEVQIGMDKKNLAASAMFNKHTNYKHVRETHFKRRNAGGLGYGKSTETTLKISHVDPIRMVSRGLQHPSTDPKAKVQRAVPERKRFCKNVNFKRSQSSAPSKIQMLVPFRCLTLVWDFFCHQNRVSGHHVTSSLNFALFYDKTNSRVLVDGKIQYSERFWNAKSSLEPFWTSKSSFGVL